MTAMELDRLRAELEARVDPARPAPEVLDDEVLSGLQELESLSGRDLMVPIVQMFIRDSVQGLARVSRGIADDIGGLRQALHKLKGSAANIGAFQVADLCLEVETLLQRKEPPLTGELVDRLGVEVARATEALTALVLQPAGTSAVDLGTSASPQQALPVELA